MAGDDIAAPRRRSLDRPIGERMTDIESGLLHFNRRFDDHLAASTKLNESTQQLIVDLDKRADKQELAMARLLAGLAVVMFLGQVFAPLVRQLLGLPT